MIEKIKKIWNKHDNLIIITVILISTIGWCLDIYIDSKDELWNFMNICKMINGYKIYSDANIITTPLFFYLGYIILKYIGTNLLIFRLYNLFIMIAMIFIIYLIMKKLIKNKFRALVYFFVVLVYITPISPGGANYTPLALVFVLLGIYFNLKSLYSNKKNNIVQATLMFLVFITKQNMGVYYIAGIILYQLILNKKNIKNIIKQIFIFLSEIGLVILILKHKGILWDFVNMTVLGLREFSGKNFSGNVLDFLTVFLFGISAIGVVIYLVKSSKIQKEQKDILILLMCIAVPMLLIQYPIFNNYHKALSNVIFFILIMYCLDICILKFFINKYKWIKILTIISIIIFSSISIYYLANWTKYMINDNKFNYLDYYFGGIFTAEEAERFENITNYIKQQEKRVIIFSSQAAIYVIPLELNNKAMDLPLLRKYGERWRRINVKNHKANAKCTIFNFK